MRAQRAHCCITVLEPLSVQKPTPAPGNRAEPDSEQAHRHFEEQAAMSGLISPREHQRAAGAGGMIDINSLTGTVQQAVLQSLGLLVRQDLALPPLCCRAG